MEKQRIILIGAGGHCKSCIEVIEQEGSLLIVGIVDVEDKVGQNILGYPIIGTDDDIEELKNKTDGFLITIGQIGEPKVRKVLYKHLKTIGAKIFTVIAKSAIVSNHSEIGEGTIVLNGAIVNADAKIGANCIINTRSIIEHDVVIGEHCHVSTGAIINGGASLGNDSFYGSSAVCKEGAIMDKKSFVKANSIQK